MSENMVELKEAQDRIAKLISDFQDEHKKLTEEGKANSDTLLKMKESVEKLTGSYAETAQKLESETEARKSLELNLSRMNESGDGKTKSDPNYVKAFSRYLRTREGIPAQDQESEIKSMLSFYDLGHMSEEEKSMAVKTLMVGSNPDGGFWVPVERLSRLVTRYFESTPMRGLATTVTTGTEAVEIVLDDDQMESFKVGELDARPQTATARIGLVTIPVHEQFANIPVTQKMLDDSAFPIENWIQNKIADRFSRVENWEYINGSAAHEATGICTYPDWATLGVYERTALETRTITGVTGSADDLIDLQSDLLEPYQPNARWIMHRKVFAELCKLKDTTGQYLINPMMLFSGTTLQVLGKPVVYSGDMAQDNDSENIVILYGDFREGYLIVDRIGIRVLRDPYTSKPLILFYATKRSGAAVCNFQAIKRLRGSGT